MKRSRATAAAPPLQSPAELKLAATPPVGRLYVALDCPDPIVHGYVRVSVFTGSCVQTPCAQLNGQSSA
jgi:hypothetical protein